MPQQREQMMAQKQKNTTVKNVIVFASYNESKNLRLLFEELIPQLTKHDAVIVADDSNETESAATQLLVEEFAHKYELLLSVSSSTFKGGRGAAIRRGFEFGLHQFPNADYFIESDSDGSHRMLDVLKLRDWNQSSPSLLIGSRYLKDSSINGWTLTRRCFSKTLNVLIPLLLGLRLRDVTNGLRRYSRDAVVSILATEPQNMGFIYLSEVALLLSKSNFVIEETAIVFDDRVYGSSSVTWRELSDSLIGVSRLFLGTTK
jgi:glycosyltransferase involved in cell wall biosynthesis